MIHDLLRGAAALVVTGALVTPTAAQSPVLRLNCGGDAVSHPVAGDWIGDQPYGPGVPAGHVGGEVIGSSGAIGGPFNVFGVVHNSARVGFSAYRVDLAPGERTVAWRPLVE